MTRWAKAGVRATPAEVDARAQRRRRDRGRWNTGVEELRVAWDRGRIRPDVLTLALNLAGQYGPEVDAACGVEEPTVDRWETGEIYPTFEQLLALTRLCQVGPAFFTREHEVIPVAATSMRFHLPAHELREDPPVLQFDLAAIERTVGHPVGR